MSDRNRKFCFLILLMILGIFMFGCGKEQRGVSAEIADDIFREIVIEEGIVYEDDVFYEFDGEGAFVSGDAALDAEEIGTMILNMLEHKDVKDCREAFSDDTFFVKFQNQDWGQLEAGWTANGHFDCYYTYVTEAQGYVSYAYYIYPDFDRMGVETAQAVIFRCAVNVEDRKLGDTQLELYDMSLTEYCSAREWMGGRAPIIENGEIEGGGLIEIPGQDTEEKKKYIDPYEDMGSERLVDLLRNDLKGGSLESGKTNKFLLERDSTDLADMNGEIRETIKAGWNLSDKYDFYYIYQNERDGAVHYKYYFYWEKPEADYEKVLVTDAWISEKGIEEMQNHWFLTRRHNRTKVPADEYSVVYKYRVSDIGPFLDVDWTDSDILMLEHAIMPQDSARGWEFAIADVDFDEKPEMLITFTANHCGGNSLYVYKQENGNVFSYADTIATPAHCMLSGINYKEISPYLDIELMDAYRNGHGEYRYLSLDYSLFGGDIHGGFDTVVLYETDLGTGRPPEEIARIEYCGPDQRKELYFQGEKVYEAGRLRDLLEDYMDGYVKLEIPYNAVEKSFARDIVGLNEEEREKENRELLDAIKGAGMKKCN